MTKQLICITVFVCTVSVTINFFGKVDAYLTESATYTWTDSDLDNLIPDEDDDVFNKPHSYFAYSIHDNEDTMHMKRETNDIADEIVVPLTDLIELSSNRGSNNESEKSDDTSKKEFINDMHQLINALVEEGAVEMPLEEQEQEQVVEVSIPLVNEELTFDPTEDAKLFSLVVPESHKDNTQNKSQKQLISSESNPVLVDSLSKESSYNDFFTPSKSDNLIQNQRPTMSSLRTNNNEGIGDVILEMDLFPLETKVPNPVHRSTYSFVQENPLLPFLLSSRPPETTLPHSSWHSLLYPPNSYIHQSPPSAKFYFNTNGEIKYINPRKILNSLKATSIGEMKYQPLGEVLFNSQMVSDDSAHFLGRSAYHHDAASYDTLDLGSLLHGGILVSNLKENEYMHKDPRMSPGDAAKHLEVLMNPTKKLHRKMMVFEPPAVLRIEPVVCHPAYKQPRPHIVF